MNAQNVIIVIAIGYLLGCIQTAYIIGRVFKKSDIRKYGTSNAGASNATFVWGWKYGITVALIDILKAVAAVLLIKYIYIHNRDLNSLSYLTGGSVILGHNYPFYMGFRGGKGTASLVGMLLALDWRMALIGIILIVIVTVATDYIALGTMAMTSAFLVCTIIFNFGTAAIITSSVLAALCIYNHLPNIKRIITHKEAGLRSALSR